MMNRLEKIETTLITFGHENALDVFEGAYTETDGGIVIPEHRIRLADYSSEGTLRVNLGTHRAITPLEFLASTFEELERPNGLLKAADTKDILYTWGTDGPQHAYARRLLYPFNEAGRAFAHPADESVRYVRLGIEISWDCDADETFEIEDQITGRLEAAGADIYQAATQDEIQSQLVAELERRDLKQVDTRAGRQPIVLKMGNVVLGSIPDEEDWIMQQGFASTASYESFAAQQLDEPYYDKLTPGAPDLDGFVGATVLVPYDLELLKTTKLAFIKNPSTGALAGGDFGDGQLMSGSK